MGSIMIWLLRSFSQRLTICAAFRLSYLYHTFSRKIIQLLALPRCRTILPVNRLVPVPSERVTT